MSTTSNNHTQTAFDELIKNEPDICSNCFRRLRNRYSIDKINVKGEVQELRRSTKKIVSDETDHSHIEFADFCEADTTCEGETPHCDCGIVMPGFYTRRPLDKGRFLDNAERLIERLEEYEVDFDEEEFFDYCYELKSDPDNQFHDDKMFSDAIEHVIELETIRSDGGTDFNNSRCLNRGQFDQNRELGERVTDESREEHCEKSVEEYRGELVHDIPEVPGNVCCNARLHNNRYQFLGYCNQEVNDSRCPLHDHEPQWPAKNRLEDNQFATKHGLHSDPEKYLEAMDDTEELTEIEKTEQSIINRLEQQGEVDRMDRKMAKQIAVRVSIAEEASDYIKDTGLTQTVWTEEGSHEKKNPVLSELRLYDASIVDDMKNLGVLDDPESQKADSLDAWREYIE